MIARLRLRAWIRKHTNQRRFAADIGIDETYLSQVLSGKRVPRLPILGRIEAETGIPIGGWLPFTHGAADSQRKSRRKRANVGGEKSRAVVG